MEFPEPVKEFPWDGLKVHKKFVEIPWAWPMEFPQGRLKIHLKYVEIPGEGGPKNGCPQ